MTIKRIEEVIESAYRTGLVGHDEKIEMLTMLGTRTLERADYIEDQFYTLKAQELGPKSSEGEVRRKIEELLLVMHEGALPEPSKSYPLLWVARRTGADYGAVLDYADYLEDTDGCLPYRDRRKWMDLQPWERLGVKQCAAVMAVVSEERGRRRMVQHD